MTRGTSKKSIALTAIMALVVLMAMGVNDVFGDYEADRLVHEFGELLEGVEAEILSIPNDTEPSVNTTDAMQSGKILSDVAYLKAFDETIRKQIL
ncbi:MAG: hypothetical protein ACR2LL_07720 [Nitrosopumilus sp.]|uniref:hypothetical protein n=1 Tax=Nitrosopumilus sp. TaxID=2024843 RepID=UPI00292CC55F|nr:hypothetical protein [Nitrosopumilus sp.]